MKKLSLSNERKIGVLLSYASIALNVVTGLLYTPIMLRLMGKAEYGLYGTVCSFVSLLYLLDAGFSSSYIRFYSKYKNEGQFEKIYSYNALYLLVFSAMAVLSLLLGLFFSFNLKFVFDDGLTAGEYDKAKIMMLFLTFIVAANFLTNVFNCYISAHEKFVFFKVYSLISSILSVIVNLIVLKFGFGALGLVIVAVVFNLLNRLLYIWYAVKKLDIKFDFHNIEKGLFKKIFAFSGLIAVNMIVDKVNVGMDSVILGRFCGTAVVAIYSVAASLSNHFMLFSTAISGIFVARVHDLVNGYKMDSPQQRTALTEFFVKVGRIQYIILALICTGFIFFGKPFIQFWAGEGYEQSYSTALLLMIPNIIPLSQNVCIEIQRAENRHHYRSIIYGIMAIFNFVISLLLCQKYQAVGVAVGTCIATVIANIVIMNILYDKKININIIEYWKAIFKQTLGVFPALVIGFLLMKFIEIDSIVTLITCIVIYTVAFSFFAWFLSFNDYEKQFFKGLFNKLFHK